MPRSLKKGPFVDDHLLKKVDALNATGEKQGHQDLVAPLHDHPRDGRSHHRRARRAQARARLHHRVDGRSQARRVRAHPHVPVPRRPGDGRAAADGLRCRRPTSAPAPAPRLRYVRVVGLQGPPGARPHPRQARRPRPLEILAVLRARRRPRRSARCSTRPSPTPSTTTTCPPTSSSSSACFADEGPTLQALAPPGPRPRHPHPQAHLPHHDHRRPLSADDELERRRPRGAPAGRRAAAAGAAADAAAAAGASPAAARPTAEHEADEAEHEHDRRRTIDDRRRSTRPTTTDDEVAEADDVDEADRAPRPTPADTDAETDEADADAAESRRRRRRRREGRADGPEGQPVRVPARRSPPTGSRAGSPTARSTRDYLIEDWKIRDYLHDAAAARRHQPRRDRAHPRPPARRRAHRPSRASSSVAAAPRPTASAPG